MPSCKQIIKKTANCGLFLRDYSNTCMRLYYLSIISFSPK